MNKNQANSIIAFSKQAEEYDYDALVKRLFPQSQDWAAITVGQNSLSDFIFLAKKVFRQFQSEFKDINNALAYPIYYTHSQYGQSTIDAQISNFLNHLNSNNINAADNYLQWLVGYQVQHGFYFKPIRRTSEITTSDLNRLSEQLNLHQKTISDKLEQVENLISELNNQRKQLQNLIDQKKDELNQITVNLSTSNTQTNQINELLNKSTEQSSRINTILEQQEDNKKQYNKNLSETLKLYDDAYAAIHEEERVIKSLIADFENQKKLHDDHLLFVQEKRTFFEERNNYLNNLIGREVGASLFETFKQRKAELTGPITFWRYSVPIMTIATVLWIFFLFSNQVGIADYNLWWQAFALNTLKTIPALFLLVFTINQYRKERNFQEEYAFKSAVALTIDAYAGRLSDPINKDKLIMEAVLNIYKTPIEEKYNDRIKNQTALETIKSLADTTKDLVKKH